MSSIKHKNDFVDLWLDLKLGNRMRAWKSIDGYLFDPKCSNPVNMRTRRDHGGGFVEYGVPYHQTTVIARKWEEKGIKRSDIFFNEPAPDDMLVTQGYLMRTTEFYHLDYNEAKIKMRPAMERPNTMTGSTVMGYLRPKMSPDSWDDLQELLTEYPDDVIEFGIYENNVGVLPGRNMLVWEVRGY